MQKQLSLSILLPAALFASAALSSRAASDSSVSESHPGEFTFSLLPKVFQKNPKIYMTVISEMTPDGKKVAPPTAEKPTYYVEETAGYHDEGQGVTGERPIPIPALEAQLKSSLATSHFLPAAPGRPATLVIIFIWGSHNTLDTDATSAQINLESGGDLGAATGFTDVGHKNLLARAALVGGMKFALDLEKVLRDEDAMNASGGTGGHPTPLEIFTDKSVKNRELIEQAYDDCYYVVASAYEGAALAHGQRKLLWRTKMTTNSRGVAMAQSLPALISTGGPYFGKDMSEAATLERRELPEGNVKVGTPVEVKDNPKTP
jgi:hypothetical protein